MPTGARGEAVLELDGQEYPILFTNRALAEAERALGRTVLQLASGAASGELGMGDVARLAAIGLEHARRDRRDNHKPYTMEDAWMLLDALGFVEVGRQVMDALTDVISWRPAEEPSDPPE